MNIIKIITDEDFQKENIKMTNPRIRIGARGIVINEEGKIAIFNKSNKNEYKLPGGGVDDNEKPEDAFIREVLEETGMDIEIIEELGTIEEHKSYDNFKQISHVFVGKVVEDTKKLNLTQKEIDEGGKLEWLDLDEALIKITKCIDDLLPSKYENLYHTKFIVTRDKSILEYYINKRRLNETSKTNTSTPL